VRERTLERARKGALVFYEGEEEGSGRHSLATREDGMWQQDARSEDCLSPVPRPGLRLPAALRVAEWSLEPSLRVLQYTLLCI
jgi:hypothetical protein